MEVGEDSEDEGLGFEYSMNENGYNTIELEEITINKFEEISIIKNELSALPMLPNEIIWNIASFFHEEDPVYKVLQKFTNLRLTKKEINLLLWKFYKKLIHRSNLSEVLKRIDIKLKALKPEFPNYGNFYRACLCLKNRVERLFNKFNNTYLKLKISLYKRDYSKYKEILINFVDSSIKAIESLEKNGLSYQEHDTEKQEIKIDKNVLFKELCLIIQKLKDSIFPHIIFMHIKDQCKSMSKQSLLTLSFTIFNGILYIVLLHLLIPENKEFIAISYKLIVPVILLIAFCCGCIVSGVYLKNVYSGSDPENYLDLLDVLLESAKAKFSLLDDRQNLEQIKLFFDKDSSYARIWEVQLSDTDLDEEQALKTDGEELQVIVV